MKLQEQIDQHKAAARRCKDLEADDFENKRRIQDLTAFNATLADRLARSREARRDAEEARKAGRKQVNEALAELSSSYAELEKTLERLTLQNAELRRNKDALRKALERTRNAAADSSDPNPTPASNRVITLEAFVEENAGTTIQLQVGSRHLYAPTLRRLIMLLMNDEVSSTKMPQILRSIFLALNLSTTGLPDETTVRRIRSEAGLLAQAELGMQLHFQVKEHGSFGLGHDGTTDRQLKMASIVIHTEAGATPAGVFPVISHDVPDMLKAYKAEIEKLSSALHDLHGIDPTFVSLTVC